MEEEKVVLVDLQDQQVGTMGKMEAHKKAVLHRAFSIFILNSNRELLLQQRAFGKYHSPGLWTNTCCSHQREGETNLQAGNRRLREEMGMTVSLEELFTFNYRQGYGDKYFGEFDTHIMKNPQHYFNLVQSNLTHLKIEDIVNKIKPHLED